MNVTVENIGPCKRLLRVEADVNEVERGFEEVTRDFLKHATLPGFRPGKAPKDMVVRRFEKEISQETREKLVRDLFQAAVEQQKIQIYHIQDVETVSFNRGQPMQFTVTVEVKPEFELPNYRQIPVTVEARTVTDKDVEDALEALRQQQKGYRTVERVATAEDVLVIDAKATVEGVPISQKLGANTSMYESPKGFWVGAQRELGPNFFAQLVGAGAGEKRTLQVTYPADYPTKEMAGQTVTYEVEVREVREPFVPPLDEAFAKQMGAESVEALRAGVRKDLENEVKYRRRNQIVNQVVMHLVQAVNFELPETALQEETRNEVYQRVANLQQRGLSPQQIEEQKDHIFSSSQGTAFVRVKLDFILEKIAQAENIQVTQQQVAEYLTYLAYQRQVPAEQLVKEMQKSGELSAVYRRLLLDRALDFVVDQAQVTEKAPAAAGDAGEAPAGGA
ncbi:trigger factor [Fontisphaera persica]|uniref:trigger factor n=1 Tax=Fontisphaera persica TaxID=2974023 RepID=UPI0024C0010E|nr:trigger factor [Fontisphaera persica]WCJ57890.1 trigger factor [Fontisphaera persica]